MSHLMPTDLTRWNRAGMSRFDYVDGDAAIWLERLREILTGLYAKGVPVEMRQPEALRDLFLTETSDLERAEVDVEALRRSLVWQRLAQALPPATEDGVKLESRGQRGLRVRAQYEAGSDGDYAWDILRAFARASHVTLGHLNAYANEGYLRTATQWDNLRRLAALVNYQPTPAASASTLVALELKPDAGSTEIAAGLAMKHTPTTGKPLVFETLSKLLAHPDLNAARVVSWDVNTTPLPVQNADWLNPDADAISPGELAIVAGHGKGQVVTLTDVRDQSEDGDDSMLRLTFAQGLARRPETSRAMLWRDPADVLRALPRSTEDTRIVELERPNALQKSDLVELRGGTTSRILRVVDRNESRVTLALPKDVDLPDEFELVPLTPLASVKPGVFQGPTPKIDRIFYINGSDVVAQMWGDDTDDLEGLEVIREGVGEVRSDKSGAPLVGYTFKPPHRPDVVYMRLQGEKTVSAKVVKDPKVTGEDSARVASFQGALPKGLSRGAYFIRRNRRDGAMQALRVRGLRQDKGQFHVEFDANIPAPHQSEFIGPLQKSLRPDGHDYNPAPFGNLAHFTLENISDAAMDILRPGRPLIISDSVTDVQASLATIKPLGGGRVEISLEIAGSIAPMTRGDTVFQLNAVTAGHGESKGPKTLGSGDGEQMRQSFLLQLADISHIASPVPESGVMPALEVAVEGEVWPYADYINPAADGTRSWSSTLGEDGFLTIHFRRRLPTGSNNVTLMRHRVGTGARGSGLPPFSLVEPSKKHAAVKAVYQPFASSGGADREPVESLRTSAPARLSSNGRAVSLRDTEMLCNRHAAIWRARAHEVATARRTRLVRLHVVPAGGAELNEQLKLDLQEALGGRVLPGVTLAFEPYTPLYLRIWADIRADLTSYDATDIAGACDAALRTRFALKQRDFGQPAYISEAIAALEAVTGVATSIITRFDYGPNTPRNLPRVMVRDDQIVTIFPRANEVAHIGENSAAATLSGAPSISVNVRGLHD
ncbi:hypothetical protein BDE40_1233 [Litoreibacter halocynthiae]|uniref:Phage baseplate assembly protein n=1 Tax=Litoreibacter halocynthiae TaxID=1242689 RepID=A0A4R7LSX4_9RHOB|nr:hypothetical protein [Litoreibacter halocynthiae]TDT77932.1 hypothetical protein BDE40_1233 [Litoreibacter halocynthiae]